MDPGEWKPASDSIEKLNLPGYHLVSRADRLTGAKRGYGGVVIFERDGLNMLVHLESSSEAERVWAVLHTDVGPFLLGNWYRPPDAPWSQTESLSSELTRLADDYVGVILVGDMNVHHARWLRHSNGNTALGATLWDICQNHGLVQCVREATRGEYLPELVLTDLVSMTKTKVLPQIADHSIVGVDLAIPAPSPSSCSKKGLELSPRGLEGAAECVPRL